MSMRLNSGLALVLSGAMAAGCAPTPAAPQTPTITSQDVLATAQAMAELTRQAGPPTPIPPTLTSTPSTPTETPTPTATPTQTTPMLSANYNAFVRSGPGEDYPPVDFLLQGQQAQVVGRYDASSIGTWWLIKRIGPGINGWVWSGAVTQSGDFSGVPVLEAPPMPTPGPSATPAGG